MFEFLRRADQINAQVEIVKVNGASPGGDIKMGACLMCIYIFLFLLC